MSSDVVLRVDDSAGSGVELVVAPQAGGRLRRLTVTTGGDSAEVLAPVGDAALGSLAWGCYPMAPWVGRIRHGRFRFLDEDIRLDLNHSDGGAAGGGPITPPDTGPRDIEETDRRHAIHGTTYDRAWTVVESTDTTIEMTCPIDGSRNWPFAGIARQRIALHADRLDLELGVEVADAPAPVSVGWHPWFAKPDRLGFEPVAMYRRDEIGITTSELITPAPPPWDDCFVNRRPVTLHFDRDVVSTVVVSSDDCDHWVVFDGSAAGTCVEPQSAPPDSPNLRPELATSDHPVRRTMSIRW